MAQDSMQSVPPLSIINGPSAKGLKDAFGMTDFTNEPEPGVFFKVQGMPCGIYLGVRSLKCLDDNGYRLEVSGWWLNSANQEDVVTMVYNTDSRTGRITQLC